MSRAELRRAERENSKKQKTYTMTAEELEKYKRQAFEHARKELLERNDELANELFTMMLVIPTNVLIADYWPKSAKKLIPQFVKKCMSLFDAWSQYDVVKMQEMVALTEEYSGVKLVEDSTVTGKVINSKKYRAN